MVPDFSKKTIDVLGKRAAYRCSNPDCRKSTVGPNSDDDKATLIGEAAHIFGARPNSKRYSPNMTDNARSEITNAIWLCRNCHKLVDSDDSRYSSEVLFEWRELHEGFTLSELGNSTDQIIHQEQLSKVEAFSEFPPIIRRIVLDKPRGWEYRLTAELMRFLNSPIHRKMDDLRAELYLKSQNHIADYDVLDWVQMNLAEQERIVAPIENLASKLNSSWGELGESGSVDDIFHITHLIRDYLEHALEFEENLYFTNVPKEYKNIHELLKGNISSLLDQLKSLPDDLDEIVALIISGEHEGTEEKPLIIKKNISFDLPKNWQKKMNKEIKRIVKMQNFEEEPRERSNLMTIFWVVVFLGILGHFV